MRFIILILVTQYLISGSRSFAQDQVTYPAVSLSYSIVNLGVIDEWSVPLTIDERRPYMHFILGVEVRLKKHFALRFDYLSKYSNLGDFPYIFHPSVSTVAPRVYFNTNKDIQLYVDLKVGVANVTKDYSLNNPYSLNGIPIVIGSKTGIVADVAKRLSIGFGFDNLGIWYRYNNNFFDATRISLMTTDIVVHLGKRGT